MTTRTVTTERTTADLQVPSPDLALVRAQRTSLPLAFSVQSQAHHPAHAREPAVNNAMLAQMFENIYRMGQDSRGSDEENHRLTSENRELRQHISQRMDALEKEWFGVAERLSAKVDGIFLKLNKFHKELTTEYAEASKIMDLERGSYWPEESQDCTLLGVATATSNMYWISNPIIERNHSWEQLHLSVRDSLKALVRAEVQKMKVEMIPEELIDEGENRLQRITALNITDLSLIDAQAVFHTFTQMHHDEIQTRDERNDAVRKRNETLNSKLNELNNVHKRLLGVFHKRLSLYLDLKNDTEHVINACNARAQEFKEQLVDRRTLAKKWSSRALGACQKGIELSGKISSHLNEILPLVEALQKEFSL